MKRSPQHILDTLAGKQAIPGVSVAMRRGNATGAGDYWAGASGNLTVDRQFFIASTTKLFTVLILRQLRAEGALSFDDVLEAHIRGDMLRDVLVVDGKQYGPTITIRQLMSHTSGLPDYFQRERHGGSLETRLLAGHDAAWNLDNVLEWVRTMKPAFRPGTQGKAEYSDTNYQLLGRVIELCTGMSYADAVCRRICQPLHLKSTYVYTDAADTRPLAMRNQANELHIPNAMVSFGPDGGIVSNAAELLTFLEAFFGNTLAPSDDLDELTREFNRIWFPFTYGTGIMRFELPWLLSPFKRQPILLGHSGLSGAFAFYAPSKTTFLAGTVNQLANRSTSFRLMLQLLDTF